MTSFRLRTTYGYAAVASTVTYSFLRSIAVDYGRNEIFEHVENRATKKNQDGETVLVDPGTSRVCLRNRDGYPTDNPELKP